METYKTYTEKLKDPRWQKRRLLILERDQWRCATCNETKETLHVHHKRYIFGVDPWEYPDDLLVTLCEGCHEFESSFKNDARLLYDIGQGCDILCITIWMHASALGFIKLTKPDKYQEIRQLLIEYTRTEGDLFFEFYSDPKAFREKYHG